MPAIIPYGFMGLTARPDGILFIRPQLPRACPEMAINDLQYRGVRLGIRASNETVQLDIRQAPQEPLHIGFSEPWLQKGLDGRDAAYTLDRAGTYYFKKSDRGHDPASSP